MVTRLGLDSTSTAWLKPVWSNKAAKTVLAPVLLNKAGDAFDVAGVVAVVAIAAIADVTRRLKFSMISNTLALAR